MNPKKFIVFEGINGCGKGTQIDLFAQYIRNSGKAVPIFITGEPNNFDDNGKKAREILHSDSDPYENSLLASEYFSKNRLTHKDIINPLLNNNVTVISDRYYHSNFAFQHAQGVSYEHIAKLNNEVIIPDLTFILDISVEESFKRLSKRDKLNRRKFDRDFEFMQKVRDNYLQLQTILPDLMNDRGIVIVDGGCSEDFVFYNLQKKFMEITS
jgi:dTMP kinase